MTSIKFRISTAIALALTLGAIATTTASARPNLDSPQPNVSALTASQPPQPSVAPTVVRVVHVYDQGGFAWGDAGIGAGSVLALVLIALGGAITTRSVVASRNRLGSRPTAKQTQS